jgi:hypothetical protein
MKWRFSQGLGRLCARDREDGHGGSVTIVKGECEREGMDRVGGMVC